MYKVSAYNCFQPWHDGLYIAFNARSGAVGLLTNENYGTYNSLVGKLSNGGQDNLSPEEKTLLGQLQYGRFVIEADEEELESLKFEHRYSRFESGSLGLTIAPTMACNMACQYCFEENKRGKMSAAVVETLIDFVEKRAPGLLRVDINWYGGEPLLAMDIIEDITLSVMDLGKEHKFKYSASMISNGYLLTRENVDKLRELRVSMVQVTLDGPAEIHDKKRPLKNGQGSFHKILENIAYAATKMGIGIRVNVDKSFNEEIILRMLGQFKEAGLQDKVGIYFGLLEPASKVCANIADTCFNPNEFSEIELSYYRILLDQGFRIDRLPTPMSAYCIAQIVNGLLIDPEGNLYHCFNHVGDKSKSFGQIADQINYQHPNFVRLFKFDPFEDDSCRQCQMLPICLGGCPSRRAERGLEGDAQCDSWKYNLQPMLEIIARSRQQQAAAAAKEKS